MAMLPGEMKLTTAAKKLGVSLKTLRKWATRAHERDPVPHGLKYGRRDPTNKLYVLADEVEKRAAEYRKALEHLEKVRRTI